MDTSVDGVTLYAFLRPGIPAVAGAQAVTQIADLYDFGLIGPGSHVWWNSDWPRAMWILSDVSTFLWVEDVPAAGWARLTKSEVAWGRRYPDVFESPRHFFGIKDMPMPAQDHDHVTVAYRNCDPTALRAQFNGRKQHLEDHKVTHARVSVVDLKTEGLARRETPIGQPGVVETTHAVQRGLSLMTATCGKNRSGQKVAKMIHDNLDSFSQVITVDDFTRIKVSRQRVTQATESITDPLTQRIAALPGFNSVNGQEDEDDDAGWESAAG